MDMRVSVGMHVFDTEPNLYGELARVFGEATGDDGVTRWVKIEDARRTVTFFAPRELGVAHDPEDDVVWALPEQVGKP